MNHESTRVKLFRDNESARPGGLLDDLMTARAARDVLLKENDLLRAEIKGLKNRLYECNRRRENFMRGYARLRRKYEGVDVDVTANDESLSST